MNERHSDFIPPQNKKKRRTNSLAVAISAIILLLSYLILLNLFFTENVTVETYACFVNEGGTHYHHPSCSYVKEGSIQSNVYEAQNGGYTMGNCCDPFRDHSQYEDYGPKITIHIRKQNNILPAVISVAISIASYIVIAETTKKSKQ